MWNTSSLKSSVFRIHFALNMLLLKSTGHSFQFFTKYQSTRCRFTAVYWSEDIKIFECGLLRFKV